MPIYAYRCAVCGHAKDVLQRMSDPLLTTCPACGAEAFTKQVTAAGFQLKGSGWYVTDFRGGNTGAPKPAADAEPAKDGAKAGNGDGAKESPSAAGKDGAKPAAADAPSRPSSSSGDGAKPAAAAPAAPDAKRAAGAATGTPATGGH